MTALFTQIPYSYTDAANYKAHGEIYLAGVLSEVDLLLIAGKLSDGEFFIPFDLGLGIVELQSSLTSFPSADDHPDHRLDLESARELDTVPEGVVAIPVADFVAAFNRIVNSEAWDADGAMVRLKLR